MPQPAINDHIQVDTSSDDDNFSDSYSIVGTNASLTSSVRDYTYENGRRYHAYRHGQYPMPNDEEEQDRLILVHHLFLLLTGGQLYRAPVTDRLRQEQHQHHQHQQQQQEEEQEQNPHNNNPDTRQTRILDLGTGTGSWVLDMAEDFPQAEIIGVDLSPIQPNWAPPNCKFFVDDIESDWTFTPDESFDFIHARTLAGGIADWDRLIRQAAAHLRPGGWLEVQEFDELIYSDDGTRERAGATIPWHEKLAYAAARFGKSLRVVDELAGCLEGAGLVGVTDQVYKCPIGTWPRNRRLKAVGQLTKTIFLESIEPYCLALFTRVLGESYDDTKREMDEVRSSLLAGDGAHIYWKVHYVFGQKPVE